MVYNQLVHLSSEVETALVQAKPIVALESTIISHGMPWPENMQTALAVEQEVRKAGATPATIAVMGGRIHIGLDEAKLKGFAQAVEVMKLSRADLAYAIAQKRMGSTTVAATMMVAELVGIEVFATGGIGGVHKGAETSFDISADLTELGRTNIITVCAGAKAVLDIKKTLEVLETEGVPVISYRSDELPAFWSRQSKIPAPLTLNSCKEIAQLWNVRQQLAQSGGLLIANPVPKQDEIPMEEMENYIDKANHKATSLGISGKDVTPFLLGEIVKLTAGRSLKTNIALIRNNARLAAEIAVELAEKER